MTTQPFAERLIDIYAGAAMTTMIDVGHRTGLWEALAHGPATSHELAERADLNERYVREWASAVTCGRIVDYDPETKAFSLPIDHAESLSGDTGKNRASAASMITFFGTQIKPIVQAFREGGGVPYSAFRPEFTTLMDQGRRREYDEFLIDRYIRVVPGLEHRLKAGISVCDIGCGTGHNVNILAGEYPNSNITGYDIAEDAIALGNAEAKELGLSNATLAVQDAADLPDDVQFDLITTFDAVHDQADPQSSLNETYKHLSDDGIYLMIDVRASSKLEENLDNPMAPSMYTTSTMHCMTVSLAEGGAGLGTAWGGQLALEMLDQAGFTNVIIQASTNPLNNIYICRK
jgi:ubiquinone/menaquinone biosynthesis C-methylase UbiE